MSNQTAADIRMRYRQLVVEWAGLRSEPKKANRVFKKHHEYYKKVRDVPDGRSAILSLLEDDEPAVRLMAAAHSLTFAPGEAEAALSKLARDDDIYAMDAEYTLRSYRAGKLNLDW